MGRPAKPLHLDEHQYQTLQQAHWNHPDRRARRRAQCLMLLHEGVDIEHTAQRCGLCRKSVGLTRDKWLAQGLAMLRDRPRRGAPRRLDEQAARQLVRQACQQPCTAVELARQHTQASGQPVSPQTVIKTLKRHGLVCKRTRHSLKKNKMPPA